MSHSGPVSEVTVTLFVQIIAKRAGGRNHENYLEKHAMGQR